MWVESKRLMIRNFSIEDVNDVFEFMSDPGMARYEMHPHMTWDETVSYIKKFAFIALSKEEPWAEYAIELKSAYRIIGGLSAKYTNTACDQVEIGYRIHPEFQKQGYATEAARLFIEELFRLGVRRVSASTSIENIASWKVMEKLGMKREAHFRKKVLIHGEYQDEYVYALLNN